MNKHAVLDLIELGPKFDREIIRAEIPRRAVRHAHEFIAAIEAEGLTDFSVGERSAVLERAVMVMGRIVRVAVAAP